jgi:hypothetical protein
METQRATSHDVEAKQHSSLNRSSSPSVLVCTKNHPEVDRIVEIFSLVWS